MHRVVIGKDYIIYEDEYVLMFYSPRDSAAVSRGLQARNLVLGIPTPTLDSFITGWRNYASPRTVHRPPCTRVRDDLARAST